MKILIAYAGKTGSTEKCAKILEQRLENATAADIAGRDIDISNYDLIITGSSIRMGMLHSKIKKFINNNRDLLKSKKTAYYICCGFPANCQKYFENNIPKELLNLAVIYDTFGGEMDISKQKGLDKFIVNMISKTEEGQKEVRILNENIDKFVEKLKGI